MRSLERAETFWTTAKRWRGQNGDYDERKLDGGKRHLTVRKLTNGSIAFKYYRTDVVTYHLNGSVALEPYASRSTERLVGDLTPRGIDPVYNIRGGKCVLVCEDGEGRYYRVKGSSIDIRPANPWLVNRDQTKPFGLMRVDRKKAKEAFKAYGYYLFAEWAAAALAMGFKPKKQEQRSGQIGAEYLKEVLPNMKHWPEFLSLHRWWVPTENSFGRWENSFGRWGKDRTVVLDRVLTEARETIYRHERCFKIETFPFVTSAGLIVKSAQDEDRWKY